MSGKVTIRKADQAIYDLCKSWPVWEKEVSRFDWVYEGEEECLILEGEFSVETADEVYSIKAGDFVTFPDGLKCVWDIKVPVRKHYNFK